MPGTHEAREGAVALRLCCTTGMGEREHRQQAGGTDLADEPTPIYQAVAEAISALSTDSEREEPARRS